MTPTTRRITRIFVTGFIAVLPLVATVILFVAIVRLLFEWLGPRSLVGTLLGRFGVGVADSAFVGYLLGFGIIIAIIFALGVLVEAGFQRGFAALIESVVRRIPLVRNVYDLFQKFVKMVAERDAEKARSFTPVWCHFGGEGGAAVLGLLSAPEPVLLGGKSYRAVLVPTAPVPIGGGLFFLPDEWVKPANIGVEAVTSIYVSMGVTTGQYLAGETKPTEQGQGGDGDGGTTSETSPKDAGA
jgi:uncharacterized membrane protein